MILKFFFWQSFQPVDLLVKMLCRYQLANCTNQGDHEKRDVDIFFENDLTFLATNINRGVLNS